VISTATIAALVFTVALLVTTAYFLMGGLPLLILKHDTPTDARFVRRFFEIYYHAAIITSGGATLAYALAGQFAFAAGTLAILVFALLLRRRIAAAMAQVGEQIQQDRGSAVSRFRRIHTAALAANGIQLIVLLWGITRIRL
jgi:hypothetical protein